MQPWLPSRVAVLATCVLVSLPVFATNGYFTHGIGARSKGMVGAGLASATGAIDVAGNPATAVAAAGDLEIGAGVFSPIRSYAASSSLANGNGGAFTIGPSRQDSGREYFLIPYAAYSFSIGDDDAIGLAFYGRGGMNTTWNGGSATFDPDGPGTTPVVTLPGTFGGGKAGVDLSQAFLDIAYARRTSEAFSWGLSAVVAVQAFEVTGIATFAPFTQSFAASGGTTLPANLSNRGHDLSTGVGAKAGFVAALAGGVRIAAAYQSVIAMSDFDDYADLFAQSGGFDIPANARIGITVAAGERMDVSFDVEHTWYSAVDSVGNPIANIFACPTVNPSSTSVSGCLGGADGAGFGWNDMTTYKVGFEWTTGNDWTWRAGFSHGSQPIPESEVLFNILAPGVIEDHVSFGFTRTTGSGVWNLALTYALEGSVAGTNTFDPTQTISLEMHQFEIEASYTFRLGGR